MTAQHDTGRRLAEHLRLEDPGRAPDWLLESTLAIIETTPQRRRWLHLPWRFPIVNMFAKLAIAVVVVAAVAMALTTFAAVGGPGPTASPSPPPTSAPSPSSTPVTIGSVTLTPTGCTWAGETSQLPAGTVRIEASNDTPDDAAFVLYAVSAGHSFPELATTIEGYDAHAHQDPLGVEIQVPANVATSDGLLGLLASGATRSLEAEVKSGSVAGFACTHGDAAKAATYDVYSVGPLEFK